MSVAETAEKLVETVNDARTWLIDLSEETIRHKPSPDRWSIAEVIGHLIDSACNNHQRFVRAQQVDILKFPFYEQNHWCAAGSYHTADYRTLVNLWHSYNLLLAHIMQSIPTEQLATDCEITTYEPCSLEHLVTDYFVHLDHHLAKLKERLP